MQKCICICVCVVYVRSYMRACVKYIVLTTDSCTCIKKMIWKIKIKNYSLFSDAAGKADSVTMFWDTAMFFFFSFKKWMVPDRTVYIYISHLFHYFPSSSAIPTANPSVPSTSARYEPSRARIFTHPGRTTAKGTFRPQSWSTPHAATGHHGNRGLWQPRPVLQHMGLIIPGARWL